MPRLIAVSILVMSVIAFAPRAVTPTSAQAPSSARGRVSEYGPANGTLVIGGGSTLGLILPILDKFIELGGGVDGTFVIVPTAQGNYDASGYPRLYSESQVLGFWRSRGLKNVKMLHTHDPAVADTAEFASVLKDATGVWFTGGRHHHIVDSYAGTRTYREFHKVLERGGVIGGSSAGATIQGEFLVRGDSTTNTIMMTREKRHFKGFEFLRRSAIDQHIDARSRWDDLIPVITKYPHLLGIGISEDTAIIVKRDEFEVMGLSEVAVHDNTKTYAPGEKPYYLLSAGDRYNMKTRTVVKHAEVQPQPVASSSAQTATAPAATIGVGPRAVSAASAGTAPSARTLDVPRLVEHALTITGGADRWWSVETVDIDSDGEIDHLRIHVINLISGDEMIWEIVREEKLQREEGALADVFSPATATTATAAARILNIAA